MEEECCCCCRYWFGCCHVVLNWVGCYECCWLASWLLGRLDVVSWLRWICVDYRRNISSGKWWGIVSLVDSCIGATCCRFWRWSSHPICLTRLNDSTALLRRLLWLLSACKMVTGEVVCSFLAMLGWQWYSNCLNYCSNIASVKRCVIISLVDNSICNTICPFFRRSSCPLWESRLGCGVVIAVVSLWIT